MVQNEMITEDELRRRIMQVERLAAMPHVVWQLIEALNDEDVSGYELERLIEREPALASKVISLANSAYYSTMERITTICQAVMIIGLDELLMLTLGVGLANTFDLSRVPREVNGEGLWLHSISVSWVAEILAKSIQYGNPSEVMMAGLLHDLGKLLFASYMTDDYVRVARMVEQGKPYFEAEENSGLLHGEAGFLLAKKWGLPEIHLDAIRHHNDPRKGSPHHVTTCLVFLADYLVKSLKFGVIHQEAREVYDTDLTACGLSDLTYRQVARKTMKELPDFIEKWRHLIHMGGPLVD